MATYRFHTTSRLCHTQDQTGLDPCLDYCSNTTGHLLIRWSRVRISPDPPVHKGSQQCGPFSFGFLECDGGYVETIRSLTVVNWMGISYAERL